MPTHKRFSRGLSARFLTELRAGYFAPVLQAFRTYNLDLQIREHYIDLYADGRRVLHLAECRGTGEYRACIHPKYVAGLPLLAGTRSGEYLQWTATDDFLTAYLAALPAILHQSLPYRKEEATVEEQLIRASCHASSPVTFFDRQLQVPGSRFRADLLGLMPTDNGQSVLLTELKYRLNNTIQDMSSQLDDYAQVFAPDGYLRDDLTAAYRTVLAQKVALGLLPPAVCFAEERPVVHGLFVLYDYNPRSELLARLRIAAAQATLRTYLCLLPAGTFQLPPPSTWEVL
jgi:hypothetical protein